MIHVQLVQHFSLECCWYYYFSLPFLVIFSIITISSLNDQCVCKSCKFIDGLPCNTYSDSTLRCSSSLLADLIFSAVMQSSMSMNNSKPFIILLILGICSSLFNLWLCLYSHKTAVVKVCALVLSCTRRWTVIFL